MGTLLGPSTAGTVCPLSPVFPRTRLLSQLLLNPPLQFLAAGPAMAPFSQGCRAAEVQGQGPHLLEGASAGLRDPAQSKGCQHCLPTWPHSCQLGRTFIHPFMCLPGQRGWKWGEEGEVRAVHTLPDDSSCPLC